MRCPFHSFFEHQEFLEDNRLWRPGSKMDNANNAAQQTARFKQLWDFSVDGKHFCTNIIAINKSHFAVCRLSREERHQYCPHKLFRRHDLKELVLCFSVKVSGIKHYMKAMPSKYFLQSKSMQIPSPQTQRSVWVMYYEATTRSPYHC